MLEKERQRVNKNMQIGIIHTAFVGDIVLSGLLVEALYKAGHQITFFTKPNTASIYKNDTRVSSVIELKKPKGIGKLAAFKEMVKQIRSAQLDVLICPHKSLTTTLCAYFSKINITIGFRNASMSRLYKQRVPFKRELHECLRYLELLPENVCPTHIRNSVSNIQRPVLSYTDEFIDGQLHILPQNLKGSSYAVVALGSIWQTKKYTHSHYIEICKKILKNFPNLKIILTGINTEFEESENLKNNLKNFSDRIYNFSGKMNLNQLLSVISKSCVVICNDSAPTHFASAFNRPCICFFGPTDVEFGFKPMSQKSLIISYKSIFGENLYCQPCGSHGSKTCPQKHHKCMKSLTPEIIFPRIKSFLKQVL